MRDLRIVFMGTPEFAVTSLDKILDSGYRVVGVITAPDKPAGRGRKLTQSAVKKFALEKGLHLLQPTKLKDPGFLEALKALEANLFVVVAFRMLPEVVWKMPLYGTFNLHASLLPQYRGAAPINWAVINGEKETGVTTFFINERIDTGEMILQEKTEIGDSETAGEVHDRLMVLGARLVTRTIDLIAADEVRTEVQSESAELKPAPKIHKETCRVNWHQDATSILNHIRGLSPYPGAWSTLHNGSEKTDIKIFKADFESAEHKIESGRLFPGKKELKVAVEDGFISLWEVQLSGKRRMGISKVLNGLKIEKEAYLS